MAGEGEYPGNLTPYVIVTCVIAATGGLIFGYDVGISGGVTSMEPFLKKYFPSVVKQQMEDSSVNAYCQFDSHLLSMFTSSLYLAALSSSIAASTLTRKLGRKLTMVVGGALFCVGALINALARAVWMLIVGRILQGFGVGFSNQSEMAPYKYRGALNIGFQLCITLGILAANLLNYAFAKINGGFGWRLSLGGAAVPATIVIIGALSLPETPNFMIERGEYEKARDRLRRLRGVADVDQELNDLVLASEALKKVANPWRNLFKNKYRFYLMMAIAIPLFQGLSGINVIVFYAPVVLRSIGFGSKAALISTVITGGVNILATVVSIYGVDRWGRRFLFIQGGIQMLISQIAVGICIAVIYGVDGEVRETIPKWYAIVVVVFICIYLGGFAWSWGPLGWQLPSKIFPLEIRTAAQSWNVSVVSNFLPNFSPTHFPSLVGSPLLLSQRFSLVLWPLQLLLQLCALVALSLSDSFHLHLVSGV